MSDICTLFSSTSEWLRSQLAHIFQISIKYQGGMAIKMWNKCLYLFHVQTLSFSEDYVQFSKSAVRLIGQRDLLVFNVNSDDCCVHV